MITIPAPIRDLFHGQPQSTHFVYANNTTEYARSTIMYRYAALMGVMVHALFIIIFLFIQVPEMMFFNFFSVIIFLGGLFLLRFGFFLTAVNLAFIEVTSHAICASYFVGWNSGYCYYIFLIPVLMFLTPMAKHPIDVTTKVMWYTIPIGAFFTGWNYLHAASPIYRLSSGAITFLQGSNLLGFSLTLSVIALAFGLAVKRAEDALQAERDKSEGLLHNILPVPIADRLKKDDKNPVDGFNETSILFADIVGFTPISESCTPEVLVGMLNDVFTRFDDLADKHGLEKIKTIGDAYMVAAGIPEHRKDHATAIANMALDMVQCLSQVDSAPCQNLSIRVGINSGPAVAGVIGKRKFAYDLWGDTVNTAARMESHGISGEIQVTEQTYKLLKGHFVFEDRGEVEIKGKGTMRTYLLRGRIAKTAAA